MLETVRALKKNNFPERFIKEAFDNLKELYDLGVLKGVPLDNILHLAKDLEIDLNLYAGDAIHVASAISYGRNVFWSSDKHHLKTSTKEYVGRYHMTILSLDQLD